MTDDRYRGLAAAALCGRPAPFDPTPDEVDDFVRWVSAEGLAGLLVRPPSSWAAASGPLHDALFAASCRQLAIGALQERELRVLVRELVGAGVSPIFLKGAALAYSLYEDSTLRARRDTDFLIPERAVAVTRRLLEHLGYEAVAQSGGQLAASQFHYGRYDAHGVHQALDIHLRISNVLAYADSLSYDELLAEAVPMPEIGGGALVPSPVHALLVACVHRIAHHQDTTRLLWLLDIHLLGRALGDADWARTLDLARRKRLSAVLLLGLERAEEAFGSLVPADVRPRLERAVGHERARPLFGDGTTKLGVVWSDLVAASGWRSRIQLMREHAFPPRSYMRQAYGRYPQALLPLAYVARIVRGAPKWFRRAQDL